MSKMNDNDDDSGDDSYLNEILTYKIIDSDDKELPRPFFETNQPKTQAVIGLSQRSKMWITDILYSLNELPEMIEVSRYSMLIGYGMGLATIGRTEAPSQLSSLFVLLAARDCAI